MFLLYYPLVVRLCNGFANCADHGDEVCPDGAHNVRPNGVKYRNCSGGATQISEQLFCDGIFHYPGKDDEDPERCHDIYSKP